MNRRRARSRTAAIRAWIVVSTLALWFGASERVADAQTSFDLTWTAPPDCPDRAWVMAAVQRLVTTTPAQPLRVTAVVREEDGRWVVALDLEGAATGTRTLRASSCRSVARAAALIVALAIDPQATLAPEDLAPNESASNEAAPAAPTEHARPSESTPPPKPALASSPPPVGIRPIAFAGAGAERALLPGLVPVAILGGGVVWRALRVDASAHLAPSASASLARIPGVGADFSLAALSLRTCATHAWPWLALHGCAAVRGARIAGEGTGLAESYRKTAHLVAVEPGVLVRIPGGTRVAVEVDVAAVLPVTRPDFVLLRNDTHESIFRVSAIGLRAGIAASFRF